MLVWKRVTALLLTVILTVLLFVGCAANKQVSIDEGQVPTVDKSEETKAPAKDDAAKDPADKNAEDTKTPAAEPEKENEKPTAEADEVPQEESEEYAGDLEIASLAENAAVPTVLMPEASGTLVLGNAKAEIDASNAQDGYVMVRYLQGGSDKIKVIVTGPNGGKYTYNLNAGGNYETFPLSDGSGQYKINVYRNVTGTKYAAVSAGTVDVVLKDEFAPFLLPNQYVNYTAESEMVKKAEELTANCADEVASIQAVYQYVVGNLTYDKQRAATVKSGYLPNLDSVLAEKKGICFDYAALMTGMLRSQGIPCKLVVGYAGTAYHAWINAYTAEQGWITNAIYFDGVSWKLMDPTFASTGNSSPEVMKYIGDGKNYTAMYLY